MKPEEVKKVAIFGAGTMGPGLAQVFATAGHDVTMYSRKAETIEKAVRVAKANLATFVQQDMLRESDVPAILARITTTRSVEEALPKPILSSKASPRRWMRRRRCTRSLTPSARRGP